MSECQWPICKRDALNGSVYCYDHKRLMGETSVKTLAQPIPKKSEKRKEEDKILSKMFKARMAISDRCELKIPGVCTGKAQGFDHIQKTTPLNRLDPLNLKLSCHACNGQKEINTAQANELGLSLSKFK